MRKALISPLVMVLNILVIIVLLKSKVGERNALNYLIK